MHVETRGGLDAKRLPEPVLARPHADRSAARCLYFLHRQLERGDTSVVIDCADAHGALAAFRHLGRPQDAEIVLAIGQTHDRERAVVVMDAARRGVRQGLDRCAPRACHDGPCIARLEITARHGFELDEHTVLEMDVRSASRHRDSFIAAASSVEIVPQVTVLSNDATGLVPASYPASIRRRRWRERRADRCVEPERAQVRVDARDLPQLPPCATELARVVDDLYPIADIEAQVIISRYLLHFELGAC